MKYFTRITAVLLTAYLIALPFNSRSVAGSLQDDFKAGIESYDNGEYQLAVDTFSGLVQKGYHQAEIYYNLGCAYFKMGSIGQAILNFNRALELNPTDEDIRANLQYARKFKVDKIDSPARGAISKIIDGAMNLFDINTGLTVTIALFWLACAFAIAVIWFKWRMRWIWYLLSSIIVVFILSVAVSAYHIDREISTRKGVLISKEADVRSGPGDDFPVQFTGHEGLEFNLEVQREGYWRIKLQNGVKGWVKQETVGVVS